MESEEPLTHPPKYEGRGELDIGVRSRINLDLHHGMLLVEFDDALALL